MNINVCVSFWWASVNAVGDEMIGSYSLSLQVGLRSCPASLSACPSSRLCGRRQCSVCQVGQCLLLESHSENDFINIWSGEMLTWLSNEVMLLSPSRVYDIHVSTACRPVAVRMHEALCLLSIQCSPTLRPPTCCCALVGQTPSWRSWNLLRWSVNVWRRNATLKKPERFSKAWKLP